MLFCRSCCLRSNSSINLIASLPSELLHHILTYYGDDFRDIIHFSTICKHWKEVGDHSLLWLNIRLSFYCSDLYYSIMTGASPTEKHHDGHRHPCRLNLFEEVLIYPNNRYKIIIEKEPSYLFNTLLPYQQAKLIRTVFMTIFVKFNQLWYIHCLWRLWLKRIDHKINKIAEKCFAPFVAVYGVAAQIIAADLLVDVHNYSSSLSISNHIGFISIYSFLISYSVFFAGGIINALYYEIRYPMNNNLNAQIPWKRFKPIIIAELLILGLLLSIIMLHVKLSAVYPTLHYAYIPVPMWILFTASIIAALDAMLEEKHPDFITLLCVVVSIITVVCVPLSLTLIALYYDSPGHYAVSSLVFPTIPLYLPILGLILLMILSIIDNILVLRRYCTEAYQQIRYLENVRSKTTFKLISDLARSVFLMGTVGTMIYFFIMLVRESFSLGQAMVVILVWSNCVYCSLFCLLFGR